MTKLLDPIAAPDDIGDIPIMVIDYIPMAFWFQNTDGFGIPIVGLNI